MKKIIRISLITILLMHSLLLQAQQNLNNNSPGFDSDVYAFVSDGTYTYVGGVFNFATKNSAGKTGNVSLIDKATGNPLPDSYKIFQDSGGGTIGGQVYAAIPDGSGGWFVGGNFNTVKGITRNKIVHILADNTVNPAWDSDISGSFVKSLLLVGNDLYVGGKFTTLNGGATPRDHIARLNATTGAVDGGWDLNLTSTFGVNAMVSDGTYLYIGGNFTAVGGTTRNYLARVALTDGALNMAWNPDASSGVVTLLVEGTDLYVGGAFTSFNGGVDTRNRLAKFDTSTGALDLWNPDADFTIRTMASDGTSLYVGGDFTTFNAGADTRNRLAKFNLATGSLEAWNPGANNTVNTMAVDGSDVYVGGRFTLIGGVAKNYIAKLDGITGAMDTNWGNTELNDFVNIIAKGSTNDLFVGGDFLLMGKTVNNLVRFSNATGKLDESWLPLGTDGDVNALQLTDDGFLIVGGLFNNIGGQPRNRLAKINLTTGLVDGWDPNLNSDVYSIAYDGSNLYVGGSFNTVNGGAIPRNNVAKFDAIGVVDPSWNPDANGTVEDIVFNGNDVFIGGGFSTLDGGTTPRNYIAKLDAATGVVDSWTPAVANWVSEMEMSALGIYAAGGNGASGYVVRIDPSTGAVDPTFLPVANDDVYAIAVNGDDIYIGGAFTTINSVGIDGMAKLNASDGSLDATWNLNLLTRNVFELGLIGNDLLIGGEFSLIGGELHPKFAIITLGDLALEQAGAPVAHSGTYGFGNVDMLANSGDITFDITNQGGNDLTLSGTPKVVLSGGNASDFTVDESGVAATVAGGGSTSFTVTFTPSAAGVRTAQLSIASSDPVENPYVITLQGTGVKIDQTVTFNALPQKAYSDTDFTLSATASSGLSGITYESSNLAVATITGNTVTIVGAGTTTITATEAGDGNYNTASATQTLTVNKADQIITFNSLLVKNIGDTDFTVNATASSMLTGFTYESDNTGVATISGNTVTINGAGTATITATEAGDGNFNTASASQVLFINKANQTITVFDALPNATFGDPNITLNAEAGTGLPVTFSSSDPLVASVTDKFLTVTGVGSTTITATQIGNANYNSATLSQTFLVSKTDQTVTFDALAEKNEDDQPFSLVATSDSGLPVSYESSEPAVVTVSGNTVTIVGAGTTNITASQAGDNNYNAAPDIIQQLTVNMVTGLNDDIRTDAVMVYPNPGTGIFTLKLLSEGFNFQDLDIVVYNLKGETVYRKNINVGNARLEIDITHLKDGVYFVKPVSGKTKFEILRIVKGK